MCWSAAPTQQRVTVQIPMDSPLHIMQWALWWRDTYSFVCLSMVMLMYFTMGFCFDLIPQKAPKKSLLSALQWAGTGEKKKNSLTKENICIKWKADEKICNYVPDWVKYFSASKCKLPLEPVPNGRLPGLGKAPENVTSVWYRLPPQLPFLRSTASASPRVTLPSLIRSAPPCVPDNGAQLLSGKGSVATRE